MGHSSSAYSLPVVMPSGSVMAASTMTGCQPQNVNAASRSREQPHVAGALHDVVGRREQRAAAEREDHRVGVQRPQPAVGQPGHVEIEGGPDQLGGDQRADRHADDAPDDGHDGELPDDLVVVGGRYAGGRRRRKSSCEACPCDRRQRKFSVGGHRHSYTRHYAPAGVSVGRPTDIASNDDSGRPPPARARTTRLPWPAPSR